MNADAAGKPRIGLIGAGRSGSVLALGLHQAGYPVVAVSSRLLESAEALAERIPECQIASSQQAIDRSDLVLLTVPDDSIAEVTASLTWRPGVAAVHCSGAGSLDLLEAAARQGATAGTFHPLQSLATIEQGLANLPGSVFGIESEDPELRATLETMAEGLGGRAIHLKPGDKTLYHASAVLAANCLVALADVAASLWTQFGSTREEGLASLLPLMQGAVTNLGSTGLPDALTGPIVRGDTGTVRQHIEALNQTEDDASEVYRTLAQRTISLALERGSIDEATADALRLLVDARNYAEGGDS